MKKTCINDGFLPGNDKKPNLELGREYELLETIVCDAPCLEKHYNVGIVPSVSVVTCYRCRRELPKGGRVHWANAVRFE